MSHNTLEA